MASCPWLEECGIDDVNKQRCEIVFQSDDQIEIKYSYDAAVLVPVGCVNEEIVETQRMSAENTQPSGLMQTTSTADLLKCLKMPIIRSKNTGLQPCRSSPKIVAAAGIQELQCEKTLDGHKLYQCSVCEMYFLDMFDLEDHVTAHKKEHPDCEKSFPRSSLFKIQQKKHTTERMFNCSFCSKSFIRAEYLKRHEELHKEKRYTCSLCSKSFIHSWRLKQHEKIHSGEKPYKCFVCDKSFLSSHNLKQHETIHTGERPYKCFVCDKSFLSSHNLKEHENIHTGERPYQCSQCDSDKSFNQKSNLTSHTLHSHTSIKKPFQCSFCPTSFVCSEDAKKHETIHIEKKPYGCSFCEKTFTQLLYAKRHEKSHTSDKSYKCSNCDKSYTASSALSHHVKKNHTSKKKSFSCSFCSKLFHQRSEVKQHEMIHTGERPFNCSSCEKTFRRKCYLNIHYIREHADEEYILS